MGRKKKLNCSRCGCEKCECDLFYITRLRSMPSSVRLGLKAWYEKLIVAIDKVEKEQVGT